MRQAGTGWLISKDRKRSEVGWGWNPGTSSPRSAAVAVASALAAFVSTCLLLAVCCCRQWVHEAACIHWKGIWPWPCGLEPARSSSLLTVLKLRSGLPSHWRINCKEGQNPTLLGFCYTVIPQQGRCFSHLLLFTSRIRRFASSSSCSMFADQIPGPSWK